MKQTADNSVFHLLKETFSVGLEEGSKLIGNLFSSSGEGVKNDQITRVLEQWEVELKQQRG